MRIFQVAPQSFVDSAFSCLQEVRNCHLIDCFEFTLKAVYMGESKGVGYEFLRNIAAKHPACDDHALLSHPLFDGYTNIPLEYASKMLLGDSEFT